jgi:hypothetical protein
MYKTTFRSNQRRQKLTKRLSSMLLRGRNLPDNGSLGSPKSWIMRRDDYPCVPHQQLRS